MSRLRRFRATLELVPHGGCFVVVPDDVAVAAGLKSRCRRIASPTSWRARLRKNKAAAEAFTALAPSHKREYVGLVIEAKKPETRARRIAKAVAALVAASRGRWDH